MMRGDKYQLAQIAVTWFDNLSVFLLIVLILLPICLKLQQGGGKIASLTLIVHSVWLGLTGIFLIVSLATFTRIQDALYRSGDSIDRDLPEASRDVSMTYYVFLFLAALLASANMFFAIFRKANIRKGVSHHSPLSQIKHPHKTQTNQHYIVPPPRNPNPHNLNPRLNPRGNGRLR
ncbi:hypothetical protein BJY00DRAFT_277880 [Aspergillus carlsbadensis]|nr:hypothetical protein BJY00DRAFT_277880 [Aspergillus carlsbadensis]